MVEFSIVRSLKKLKIKIQFKIVPDDNLILGQLKIAFFPNLNEVFFFQFSVVE
jgi:hypothetical protein